MDIATSVSNKSKRCAEIFNITFLALADTINEINLPKEMKNGKIG